MYGHLKVKYDIAVLGRGKGYCNLLQERDKYVRLDLQIFHTTKCYKAQNENLKFRNPIRLNRNCKQRRALFSWKCQVNPLATCDTVFTLLLHVSA